MKGKPVMLITGAAHGLGRALAGLAVAEHRVALLDREEAAGQALADELRQAGGEVLFVAADVSRERDLRQAVERVQRRWERLDVVINNAGLATAGPFESLDEAGWEQLWRVNVMGAVHGCQAALTLMKRQGHGHLVNVAALAGVTAPPGMAGYVACNAAVIRLSEALAAELAPLNIQVSVVCPDLFPSELGRRMPATDALSRARLQRALERAPESAEAVAERILAALPKRPLHIFPQPEAKRAWRRKRWRPEWFVKKMMEQARRLRRHS
ncbi:SDR family NAD(P)-dependent oxidoreductase [Alloalcanivorax profundimaris]|uniref:Short chain dehydrogenase n=1 Tax=Alloalcanivorax profundimaris TaxID=2735259 RepID=A0ABS0AVR0_9GAMM|nr:SDR family NAD(P)-dependent oxidoreductase [Alloalcanivorax profundimaris]MAO60658.1 short chain dehydrogenase [Alcanivorax sp.]MBM1145022.1 SDR family NAD(P)-dependent oxidoreductase [Alcanivorax sp. ZXX171]MCQ6261560.1 SDR family NAD(P)-dependent oxidoreductase [Alcanivorax sp. MM125-6]UWN52064.1 Diacetyl reductase [(S)-acetoin forming] [Alcanivorax sp. ALC70]MAY10415.1 short chain dehydrogenase [Alcanivorax sp.]|tara:strand:- start:10778 stop:11584 length:807 start_codon:yes stop_codon:yes gene_type:complete